ncbi:cupin domain-containing protein (plasmid) [Nostoc sp. UHCC 0926]|uniref:cupin domain-containing protein n=1 Tax=Nostoc sp. UHCC 0926 TaxID=3025190 RepID=UPI0023609DE9|nr:cupin domain-containing protein [Nostoc sp. UHCC 0926]WDD30112.1 cupin domain-containing protein [Nostoc sp. UHCC 0926]
MFENTNLIEIPRLPFLPAKHLAPGLKVCEINLAYSISPSPSFQASRFTVDPDCSSPPEQHEVHEMWFISEGKGKLYYDNQEFQIEQNDFVYFQPNKLHQVINDGSKMMVIFSIWWSY